MEISVSQLYRICEGKRCNNQYFFIGAVKAFPECRFSDLFYIAPVDSPVETTVTTTYRRFGTATGLLFSGGLNHEQQSSPAVLKALSLRE